MKKLFLLVVFLCCIVFDAEASSRKGIYYLTTPAYYEVTNLSRNGLWACGTKYDVDQECSYGFRWNLTTNKIEMLGGVCQANCVANDGTVAGSFYTSEGVSSGKTIEVPALWKNEKWTILELPNELGSWAAGISPDGKYVVGGDNQYTAYVWTDGIITKSIPATTSNGCNMAYCVSPDGTMIGGWSYAHDIDVRNSGYWTVDDGLFHDLEPDTQGSPWQSVKRFSADSKKMLYWGDYHEDENGNWGIHAIYDVETQKTTTIYPIMDDPFNFSFYDMNADATIVTGYEQNDTEDYGIIWHDGETEAVESYLENRGADFEGLDIVSSDVQGLSLIGVPGVDDSANTFAVFYYDNSYQYHTMIVAFDREMEMTPPVNLEAKQMPGLKTVKLEWEAPLGDKSALQGYNVYRNGEKIAFEPVGSTEYYDENLDYATYIYKVTAQYDEGETEHFTETTITLATQETQAPTELATRQKGYNSAFAMWNAPESNLPALSYYGDGSTTLDGFGGGSVSFESGVLFTPELMNFYKGCSIAGVTFYPATEQDSWTVNIYTHENGKLKTLYRYPVEQELDYGVKNTVKFPETIELPEGQDILVGVETKVSSASYNVQKVYEDCLNIGYTDLIRQIGESDFYSINSMSDFDVCWATGLLIAQEGTPEDIDEIDHYTVYIDNEEVATTSEQSFFNADIADGNHNFAVDAVYKDGRNSATVGSNLTIKANTAVFKAIEPTVSTTGNTVEASWSAPIDDDPTAVSYCESTPGSISPITSEDVVNIMARVDFLPADLKTYKGYQIEGVDFYPLSDATFTVELYEEGELIAEADVENVNLNTWNTIKFEAPVELDPHFTYSYVLYCSDCPVDESPLACDGKSSKDNASYMMTESDTYWSTIVDEAEIEGNWLMRLDVTDPNGNILPVNNYEVYIDGSKESTQSGLTFDKEMTETEGIHTLRVDANYAQLGKTVTGKVVKFQFTDPSGIRDIEASAKANANSYNIAGQRVNRKAKGVIIRGGKKIIASPLYQ